MQRAKAGALWILLATAACSQGPKLDLGSNDGGASAPSAEAAPQTPSLAGTWSGYAELVTFPDGSDVLTLTLTQAADGSYSGTIVFGTQPAPPPPTADPMTGYPPFLYAQEEAGVTLAVDPGSSGFAYSLQSLSFDGTRLRFNYDRNELWKLWCQLQRPIFWAGDPNGGGPSSTTPSQEAGYFCAPVLDGSLTFSLVGASSTLLDGGLVTFDPLRYALCGADSVDTALLLAGETDLDLQNVPYAVCPCSAASCMETPSFFAADMQLNGNQLDGSMVLRSTAVNDSSNVHFTRH